MKSGFVTEELVERAFYWIEPAVERILKDKETTWGPHYAIVKVLAPELGPITKLFGELEEWRDEWGDEPVDFEYIARKKLEQALRNNEPTSVTVSQHPWAIFSGEYFYPGGVAVQGMGVAMSGALGITDEEVAWMIFHALALACRLRQREMEDKGVEQLPEN